MKIQKSLFFLLLLLALMQITLGDAIIPLRQKQPKKILSRTYRNHEETESISDESSSSPNVGNIFLESELINQRYFGLVSLGKDEYDFYVSFDLHSLLTNLVCLDCDKQAKTSVQYSCPPSKCIIQTEQATDKIGTVKGYYFLEKLLISGLSVETPIFLVSEFTSPEQLIDGVVSLSAANEDNIVISLFREGLIPKKLFALKFCEENGKSELRLGGFDEKISPETIQWVPRVEKKEWAINLGRVFLGEERLFPMTQQPSAKLDTDETKILLPKEEFQAFFKLAVNHLGFCSGLSEMVCLCEKTALQSFPSLEFVFRDDQDKAFKVKIPAEELIYFDPYGQCFFIGVGMIDETKHDKDTWILGMLFLRQTYNIFDFEKKAVGFTKIGSLCD